MFTDLLPKNGEPFRVERGKADPDPAGRFLITECSASFQDSPLEVCLMFSITIEEGGKRKVDLSGDFIGKGQNQFGLRSMQPALRMVKLNVRDLSLSAGHAKKSGDLFHHVPIPMMNRGASRNLRCM